MFLKIVSCLSNIVSYVSNPVGPPYRQTFQREDAIDFSYHYVPEYIDWVTAKPLPVEKWTAIFKPFSIPTWMFFITFTLGAGPVLATLVHLSQHDPGSNVRGVQRSGGQFNRIEIVLALLSPFFGPFLGPFSSFF